MQETQEQKALTVRSPKKKLTGSLEHLVSLLEPICNWEDWTSTRSWTQLVSPLKSTGHTRVASWNMCRLRESKLRNPGYMEAICLTILRSDLDVLCLIELAEPAVTQLIVNELNQPTLPHVVKFARETKMQLPGDWRFVAPEGHTGRMYRGREFVACIYRGSSDLKVSQTKVLDVADKHFARNPFMVELRVRQHRLHLACVHLKSRGMRDSQCLRTHGEVESLAVLAQAFRELHLDDSVHLVLLGDFNLNQSHEAFNSLREHGFWPVFEADEATSTASVRQGSSSKPSDSAYDNAWLPCSLAAGDATAGQTPCFTGMKGVLLETSQHPLIPHEAGWNGFASDHCLIWFDLSLV